MLVGTIVLTVYEKADNKPRLQRSPGGEGVTHDGVHRSRRRWKSVRRITSVGCLHRSAVLDGRLGAGSSTTTGRTRARSVVLRDFVVNGAALNDEGGFTFVNGAGVWQWDGRNTPEPIVETCGRDPLQLNDCAADPEGRLIAGSCFYRPSGAYPLGKLFASIRRHGARAREGFHLANGLGWSPDTKTLYFADSVARTINAYGYDAATGSVRDRRVLAQLDGSSGLPDGLTVDAEGFIWFAEWYGGCVCRYDPDGTLERRIAVPAKQTSSLAFGGPDLRDIFITSAATSSRRP